MRSIWMAMLFLIAGCSSPAPENQRRSEPADANGPNVGIKRISGVSLTYFYGFRLPVNHIVTVQEAHAALCEALTAARCRITGMTYDVDRDRTITASLQFKLAPEIARSFGKQGVDSTVKSGGMLVSARIDSEETGAVVAAAQSDSAAIAQERQQLTAQLSKSGLSSAERVELQQRLTNLSNEQRQTQAISDEAKLKLANTPLTFSYVSGAVDPGLNDGPIWDAMKDGWANVVSGVAVIITLLITILPWIVTGAALVWMWWWARAYLRRRFMRTDA